MTCCFLECSLVFPEDDSSNKHRSDEDSLIGYEKDEEYRTYKCLFSLPRLYRAVRKLKQWSCNKCASKGCRRCLCYSFLFFVTLILLISLVLFVVLPLIFNHSITLQRSLIFQPIVGESYLYQTFDKSRLQEYYSYERTFSNQYVLVNKNDSITLGLWNITYPGVRYGINREFISPNLLYFHNEVGDRRTYSAAYYGLSDIFNVTAFDYRSYGDSSDADLLETGLVDDAIQLYKWLRNQSRGDLYIMGDKLGAAIATHVVAKLQKENISPSGLILIYPFTSLSDQIQEWYWPFGRVFSWMPWYDLMITDALERNDLAFDTSKHINKVVCPIMIFQKYHGSTLPEKLAVVASNRDATGAKVSLKKSWWSPIDAWSSDFEVLRSFIDECNNFKKNKGKV